MGFSLKYYYCFVAVMVLLPAMGYSTYFFEKSRASFYGTPDGMGTPNGACGLGDDGRTMNGGKVAAVSSRLYKNGAGCGACYQVKCTNPQLCTANGVNVVVTDYGEGDRTDFILSPRAFNGMAKPYKADKLRTLGVVDVEYQRIPCPYMGYRLKFKITEHSSNPHYLAIVILDKAGKNDIVGVDILQEDHKTWVGMRRSYGTVFDMANPPSGPITLRFHVQGANWLTYTIPTYWKAGNIYKIY